MNSTITLGGTEYTVAPIKFSILKKVLPPFLKADILSEPGITAAGILIAVSIIKKDETRMTPAEFDEIVTDWTEVNAALGVVAPLVGLKWGEKTDKNPGEVKAVD